MHEDLEKILFTASMIDERIKVLGKEIGAFYKGKEPVLLGLLKGAIPFYAALAKAMDIDLIMDFMAVSSYTGTTSGKLDIRMDMKEDVRGKDVLIVEDIIDTGQTLQMVKDLLLSRGARSVRIAVLLDKEAGRRVAIKPDWAGFIMPDAFAVGFGLDYNEKYRNLPYIGVLKGAIYGKKAE